MRSIFNAIKNRFDDLGDDIAQGIRDSDWSRVVRGIGIILFMIAAVAIISLLLLMGMWKFLHSFWGKKLIALIGGVFIIVLLFASYQENRKDASAKKHRRDTNLRLETWAEDIYEYVRDAVFLVLRTVSEHTEIVMPTSPGTIELPNAISIRDGYVVFNFFARVRKSVDGARIKRELNRTLSQLTRARELAGIPSELVLINGAYYCPLIVMDVLDFGDSINIAVVFADEKTVQIAKAKKQLNLDRLQGQRQQHRSAPYDDEI